MESLPSSILNPHPFHSRQKYKSLLHYCELSVNILKETHNLVTQIAKEENKFDHLKGAKVSLCSTRGGQITLTLAVQLTNPEMLWNMNAFVSAREGL